MKKIFLFLLVTHIKCIHVFAQEQQILPWLLKKEKVVKIIERKPLVIGEKAPIFKQKDGLGNFYSLSSFKGKYVLVDFWASWCPPCRAENPYLVKVYKKYKDKNFTIVGVTRDEEKDIHMWLIAIKEDELPWLQLSDFDQSASKLYNVVSLPTNFLIDREGKIIAINLRGERLDKVLMEVL